MKSMPISEKVCNKIYESFITPLGILAILLAYIDLHVNNHSCLLCPQLVKKNKNCSKNF